eukprot:TRINITY_DN5613_c0_g1_i3.p1 TRINITY_DN5613_c0_g1~~TRINITY_DN5613_c0_g1_i3.p1  ORF type:complete len:229 (-),score=31.21 TRINITY_DN5613_c0_g1_i3:29-715(-)
MLPNMGLSLLLPTLAQVCPLSICGSDNPTSGGLKIPGEDTNGWDFGVGAGMYVDATQEPWSKGYKMYSYITKELPEVIFKNFPAQQENQGIFGHSMGGHGALTIALKNPGKYKSVSAFSPICNVSQVPWGKKTFSAYLGPNEQSWKEYDATELVSKYKGPKLDILIDQGSQDEFLQSQLLPQSFVSEASKNSSNVNVNLRMQDGYDHSYYFISTFIGEHFNHHAKYLK